MAGPLIMYLLDRWAQSRAGKQQDIAASGRTQLGNILDQGRGGGMREPTAPGGMQMATNWGPGMGPEDNRTQLQKILGIQDPEARKTGLDILAGRQGTKAQRDLQMERLAAAKAGQKEGKTKMWATDQQGERTEHDVPDSQIADYQKRGWTIGSKPTAPPKQERVPMFKRGKGSVVDKKNILPGNVAAMEKRGWTQGETSGQETTLQTPETDNDILAKMSGIERARIKLGSQGVLDDTIYTLLGADNPEIVALLKGDQGDIEAAKAHLDQALELWKGKLSPAERAKWIKASGQTAGEKVGTASEFISQATK